VNIFGRYSKIIDYFNLGMQKHLPIQVVGEFLVGVELNPTFIHAVDHSYIREISFIYFLNYGDIIWILKYAEVIKILEFILLYVLKCDIDDT
jgi:hypothetical protein